jgi:hypothetical protein
MSCTAKRTGLVALAVIFSAGVDAAPGTGTLETDALLGYPFIVAAAIGLVLSRVVVFLVRRGRSSAHWRAGEKLGTRETW